MRIIISFLVFNLAFGHIAVAGDASAGAAKAKACESCHAGGASLNGKGTDYIAAKIGQIAAGEFAHPPLPAGLSETDIANIAAYLDGA